MSAGIITEIKLKGTTEELFEQIKAIKNYEKSRKKQYEEKQDCSYIENVRINNPFGEELKDFSDDAISRFVASNSEEINVTADGPYGVFDRLSETVLFETISDAAPTAEFAGKSFGYVTGADVELIGQFKEWDKPIADWPSKYLALDEYYIEDDAIPELYAERIKEQLPYSEFCSIFKVDEDEFDKYEYMYFIESAFGEEGFPDMEYEDFIDCCDASGIEEDEYKKAVERLSNMGILDYDTFSDDFDYTHFLEKMFYNPKTKERKRLE